MQALPAKRESKYINMNIVIAPEYIFLREQIEAVPKIIDSSNCKELYNGRNRIVQLEPCKGHNLVVKKYKRHDWFKRIVYTFFKPNKARRSFENAKELRLRGFETPHEVAYIEKREHGLITQVYYISAYTAKEPICTDLIEKEPFNRELANAYALFVASLHEAGVLHRDLNSTNVICEKSASGYAFELIDINRMRFYKGAVPKAECMKNLTLFSAFTDMFKYVLNCYAAARKWTEKDIEQAISVKISHDRNWIRRKRFTRYLKQHILRK